MPLEIVDCEQGTTEWFAARLGIPTASEFKAVLAKGEGKTRKAYMLKLAGEALTGEPMENYTNANMERGTLLEDEARDFYCFTRQVEVQRVGFLRNHGAGASPDSLIGTDGGAEFKSAFAHVQVERIDRGSLPPEHKAQVQGNIWIAEREWWDFASYAGPKLPLFVVKVYRDEEYLKTLAEEVAKFNEELAALVEKIRRYGLKEAA